MYPNSLVMMCPLFLNLLASVAFYLHVMTEGYLDFVSRSLSKYNNSQSAIEFHLACIVIGLNFLMLFLFCLSNKIWSVVAALALHSRLCIQSTTGVFKPPTSRVIIHCWSTIASGNSTWAGHDLSARPNGSITWCISWSENWASTGPQTSLCISIIGVYGDERSADPDEGSSLFLFIYWYTTVFVNLEQESFIWLSSEQLINFMYFEKHIPCMDVYTHASFFIYVNMYICMRGTVTC